MSIMDITLAYLWFVLVTSCVLFLRRFFEPEARENWNQVKRAWRDLKSADDLWSAPKRDFSPVEGNIARLVRRGFKDALLVIRDPGTGRFIQFRKYIRAVDDFGIELGLPDVAWSRNYFPKLRAHCEENGIPYRIRTQAEPDDIEFLLVDCGQDLGMAQGLARVIWTRIFGLSEDAPHDTRQYRLHMLANVVNRPEPGPRSFKLGWLHKKGTEPPSFGAAGLVSLLMILGPVALFGLLIALLSGVGEAPDWAVELGDTILSGTSGSLVFFWLFLVSIWARFYFFRMARRHPTTWFDAKILPLWNWIVIITLPIGSVLIWSGS